MKSPIFGKIRFQKIPASRGLRCFAEKQIKNWIIRRFPTEKKKATYFVEFSREGSGHTFYCRIKILLGTQTWVGQNYQGGIHQALIQCLSHQMTPVLT